MRQGRVSASGFLSGLALGSRSLVTHLTHGALKSVMAVSGGAARNIERLSLDPAYYAERDKRSMAPPESLAQGLQRGVSGLASGAIRVIGELLEVSHWSRIVGWIYWIGNSSN